MKYKIKKLLEKICSWYLVKYCGATYHPCKMKLDNTGFIIEGAMLSIKSQKDIEIIKRRVANGCYVGE